MQLVKYPLVQMDLEDCFFDPSLEEIIVSYEDIENSINSGYVSQFGFIYTTGARSYNARFASLCYMRTLA